MFSRSRVLQSERARRRRRRALRVRFIFLGTILLCLFGLIVYVFHIQAIRIERTYVLGNKLISEEEIRSLVRQDISGNYFHLFPKNNIAIFPRSVILKNLLSSYPELKKASVSIRDLQSITVTLTEREPSALFCSIGEGAESCYFADIEGFVFRQAEDYSNSSFIKFSGSTTPSQTLGSYIVPTPEFVSVMQFAKQLGDLNIHITRILVRGDRVREGTLSAGGVLIWNADQDLSSALENLKLLLADPNFKGVDKNGALSVEYMDLQNTNKIFYKTKSGK